MILGCFLFLVGMVLTTFTGFILAHTTTLREWQARLKKDELHQRVAYHMCTTHSSPQLQVVAMYMSGIHD